MRMNPHRSDTLPAHFTIYAYGDLHTAIPEESER